MQKAYRQIYLLLEELSQWNPRLDKIREIIQQPGFQYEKEEGADMISTIFVRTSYWLDKELFDDSYLYQKEKQKLLPFQTAHLKLVDIGAILLSKGFPLIYDPSAHTALGPNQLGPYVKTFVEQCHKRYALFYGKISHKDNIRRPQNSSKTRDYD